MTPKNRQRGATLIVALIMLLVLTLLSISAIRSSNINLRIAGNMQMAGEATAAAQQAIEQVISGNFTAAPAAADIPVDINANGTTDYTAHVTMPECRRSVRLKDADLPQLPAGQTHPCKSSLAIKDPGTFYSSGAPTTNNLTSCKEQQWDIKAQATSPTGADVTIHQGVSLIVPVEIECP